MPAGVLSGSGEDSGVGLVRPTCMDVGADRPFTMVLDVIFSKATSRGGPRARLLFCLEGPELRDAAELFTDRPVANISGFQHKYEHA